MSVPQSARGRRNFLLSEDDEYRRFCVSGAFMAGVPVQPVLLSYPNKLVRPTYPVKMRVVSLFLASVDSTRRLPQGELQSVPGTAK